VQVGDPGLHDLVVDGGVHHGLPVTRLDFLPPAWRRPATVSRPADTVAVSLLTAELRSSGLRCQKEFAHQVGATVQRVNAMVGFPGTGA
jgi:hypothetical protein